MHFLMPNVFQCHRDFKDWFANPLTGIIEGSQEYNEDLIARLHKVGIKHTDASLLKYLFGISEE